MMKMNDGQLLAAVNNRRPQKGHWLTQTIYIINARRRQLKKGDCHTWYKNSKWQEGLLKKTMLPLQVNGNLILLSKDGFVHLIHAVSNFFLP